jgi:acyl-[acyl-carrier-protein]-phospholipid O-acyltransferase/long-chain-fatty-acid--[acyl-carrier-protein] ligase
MLRILRLLFRLFFRFEAHNERVLGTPGPVLLLPNHVSWFDWIFLGVCLEGDWRFVTSSETAKTSPVHRWFMINRRTFPIDPISPYAAKHMAEYLQTGGRLVLFPEGRISDTGCLMKLFDGTGFLLSKTGAKVITTYLRGAQPRRQETLAAYLHSFQRRSAPAAPCHRQHGRDPGSAHRVVARSHGRATVSR